MGSITSWIRLEPRCRDDDMRETTKARVADPAWLLARQWQAAEFQGEDAGSPVLARWRATSTPITRVHAGPIEPNTRVVAARYERDALPLEALIERQPHDAESLKLAVESGMQLLRSLDAQATSRSYRADFVARFALQPPSAEERAALDAETRSTWTLMAGRVPDARRVLAALRDAATGRRLPLPGDIGIEPSDRAEVDRAIDDWLAMHDALFSRPEPRQDAWNRERCEYAFSIAGAFGEEEVPLTATQYHGGHLDWHSVDLDSEIALGAVQDNAAQPLVRAVIPAPVSFRGAPAQRFWECEDASIDYGLLPAGPGDLPHLLLSEFATSFGNDWYVIPLDLDIGTLTRTRSLVVVDSFGVRTLVPPVNDPAKPATGWSMFELSPLQRDDREAASRPPRRPASNLLYLAPALVRTLDSRPQEEVLLLRDEMANIAWAVEHVVPGRVEQRIEPAAQPDAPEVATATPDASLRYRLATEVPPNWTPLLPQRATDGSLRLVRAAMLSADGTNVVRRAQGPLLRSGGARLAIHDEEIPREGARVTRQFELTRWLGGCTLLWVALRKQVGRGEGSSALRFDAAGED